MNSKSSLSNQMIIEYINYKYVQQIPQIILKEFNMKMKKMFNKFMNKTKNYFKIRY